MPDARSHTYFCSHCDSGWDAYTEWFRHLSECNECSGHYCPQSLDVTSHYTGCEDCGNDYLCGTFASHVCPEEDYDEDDRQGIFNYSYVPDLQFRGTGDYHLGIELEISANENAEPVYAWARENGQSDLFYCKEDGSVNGFEIVTHPMTPDYFESVDWEAFFRMLNQTYPTGGSRNSEPSGHGIHVHVSRTAFTSPLALSRWAYLMNKSSEHVQRIARRTGSSWARFTDTPVAETLNWYAARHGFTYDPEPGRVTQYPVWGCRTDCDGYHHDTSGEPYQTYGRYCACIGYSDMPNPAHDEWVKRNKPSNKYNFEGMLKRFQSREYPERYRALNMSNENTVEVRVFRSTRSAANFRDSIRLVYSSVDYVRSMQPQHKTKTTKELLSWSAYVEYILDQFDVFYPTVAGMRVAGANRTDLQFTPRRNTQPRDSRGRFTTIHAA